MLTVSNWLIIGIIQTIIILVVLIGFFFLRARKYQELALQYKRLNTGKIPQQATDTAPILSPVDLKDLGILKEKLALAEQRVKNLERFRELFFDLKDKLTELMGKQQHMSERMLEAGLPVKEQHALMTSFEKLKKEKDTLEQHLHQVEAELSVLMGGPHQSPNLIVEDVNAAAIIQSQQAEIGKLIQEIADLELEAVAAQRIQTTINQLNQKSGDLTIAIEVLQDENQFLSDQIQALLKQEHEKDQQLNRQIDLITGQFSEKEKAYDELYKKHAKLESEYLNSRS